jgi:hypothetical protein
LLEENIGRHYEALRKYTEGIMRKIIQLSTFIRPDENLDGNDRDALYALCDDGTVWWYHWRDEVWIDLPRNGLQYRVDDWAESL